MSPTDFYFGGKLFACKGWSFVLAKVKFLVITLVSRIERLRGRFYVIRSHDLFAAQIDLIIIISRQALGYSP